MAKQAETLYPSEYVILYRVQQSDKIRLDNFLKEHYSRRSRESIQAAIESGVVSVERQQSPHLKIGKLKASTMLLQGDLVRVVSQKKVEPPVNFNYSILYEDDVLFVIDKPPNLPVHPSGRYFFHTLLTHLKTGGFKEALDTSKDFYLAHRIDKETSGVLVLTKDSESCAKIVSQFAKRETTKTYLAIVYGNTPEKFAISQPIGRSRTSKISLRMAAVSEDEGGQVAHTDFKTLISTPKYSLIECYPKTGRQHQIRIHLEIAGHPLVGDKLYGVDEEFALLFYERERLTPEAEHRLILPRHALHAHKLILKHPTTGETRQFVSPLASDLTLFVQQHLLKSFTP